MALYNSAVYALLDAASIPSPALIYYRELIVCNTKKTVELAGGPDRLCPHVKSHKTPELVKMQADFGITRFKCATVAEAEMTAGALAGNGAKTFHVVLAYPLIGPNIARFLALEAAFPNIVFYAIGDDESALKQLSEAAQKMGRKVRVLIDVDTGQHRTGVLPKNLKALALKMASFEGLHLCGLHCYDGHIHDSDRKTRDQKAAAIDNDVFPIRDALAKEGIDLSFVVMGGTPTFPCRTALAGEKKLYLSPGTCFINDHGYSSNYADLDFPPGAAVLTRVVSRPSSTTFTLDLGCKGLASDPQGIRGIIAGFDEAKPLFQNEEHWVWEAPPEKAPELGAVFYVIPTHICPTSALYGEILVAEKGRVVDTWAVSARNRKLKF